MREIIGQMNPGMEFADLHIHTRESDGRMKPKDAVRLAASIPHLGAIAITDHESIKGAEIAKNDCLKKGYQLEVVVGAEITTKDGHLLGLFLAEDIPSGKSVEWTIDQIHKQGGLAAGAHPMFGLSRSLRRRKAYSLARNYGNGVYLDGFEVFNAGVADIRVSKSNERATDFYLKYRPGLGAAIGSTDGHFYTIGRGLTGFTGDLYEAIKNKETVAVTLDVREKLQIFEVAIQLFGSMVIENLRRIIRYLERVRKGEELVFLQGAQRLVQKYA